VSPCYPILEKLLGIRFKPSSHTRRLRMDIEAAGSHLVHSRAPSSAGPDESDYYNLNDSSQLSSSPEAGHADDMGAGTDGKRKSAFYDYKQEKALRQTDAKLFFQQHHSQGGGQSGWNSPILRSSTWGGPTTGGLSKPGSVRSFTSSHHHNPLQTPALQQPSFNAPVGSRSQTPGITAVGLASLDKPREDSQTQGPGMGQFDPHGITESASGGVELPQLTASSANPLPFDPRGGYASSKFPDVKIDP